MGANQNNMSSGDWDERVLCRDESCTGTVGPDGCCRVCGLPLGNEPVVFEPSNEDEPSALSEPATEIPGSEAESVGADVKDDEAIIADTEEDTDTSWEERILCRDEECIGTIGPDGHCRVCGLAYEDKEQ